MAWSSSIGRFRACLIVLLVAGTSLAAGGSGVAAADAGTAAAAAAAAVAPITVAQLPNDPVNACNVPAVRTALAVCRIGGPSPACCSGLDAVYANSSSPAAWCLCIPQVLYKSAALASDSGLDVLGVLHKCRRGQPGFQTQWASASPSACPHITFSLNSAELMLQLGPDIVLAAAKKSGKEWAWANLLQFGAIMQEMPGDEIQPVWEHVVGSTFAKFMFLVIILMPPLFFAAHRACLRPWSAAYRALSAAEQLVVTEHCVYIFVFGVSLLPQTILALTSLFKAWTGWYLDSAQIGALLGVFVASRTVLYAVEASVRSVVKWSWLLIVHHQLFFLIVLLALWGRNAAVAGLGLVLDLGAVHEVPLYVGLVSYRLRWPARFTRGVLRGAMVWYVLTRVLQTVILLYMIVGFGGMPAVRQTPEFIVVAVLCGLLTMIQAYTIVIYRAVERKVSAQLAAAQDGGGKRGHAGARALQLTLPVQGFVSAGSSATNSPSSRPSNDGRIMVLSPVDGVDLRAPKSFAVRCSDGPAHSGHC